MHKITVIIPYFGKFPSLFPFWWASALNNPTIHFLVITDDKEIHSEGNIEVLNMNFEECKDIIQGCYSFPIAMPSPYKLCDQKGSYPFIFKEFVMDADFVGWGDVDLIYGDLRHFLTDEVLNNYDFISGWGHLTLLRNNDYWREFFKLDVDGLPNYKNVLSSPSNYGFDEYWHGGLADKALLLHPDKVWNPMCFDDLRIPEAHINFKSGNRRMFENDHLIFEYEEGRMYRVYLIGDNLYKEQTMYVHFKRRMNTLKLEITPCQHYLIVPNKIISYTGYDILKVYKWSHCGLARQLFYYIKIKAAAKIYKIIKKII